MDEPRVLVIDDDPAIVRHLQRYLLSTGFDPTGVTSGSEALACVSRMWIDAALIDLSLPDVPGLELMARLREKSRDLPCIIITGRGDVPTAVEAMRAGASDFLAKPFPLDDLQGALTRVLEAGVRVAGGAEQTPQGEPLRQEGTRGVGRILGRSEAIRGVIQLIEQVCASTATVLIVGESGTGKELVARAIHERSPRAKYRYVAVNCAALPDSLLEAELFGSVKGAYTGASADRQGRFSLADRGTLFLDEVGDMSPAMQAKLLRVIQEKAFEPVGSSETVRVDPRIIAATHRDLRECVADGSFRADLYYRLNVIPIEIAPLRQRPEDIPVLVEAILARLDADLPGGSCRPTADVLDALMAHDWPGNVRELENVLERAAIMSGGERIRARDLTTMLVSGRRARDRIPPPRLPPQGIDLPAAVNELEDSLIHQAMEHTAGNKVRAARLLGLKRTTLLEKLKRTRLRRLGATSAGA